MQEATQGLSHELGKGSEDIKRWEVDKRGGDPGCRKGRGSHGEPSLPWPGVL